MKMINEIKKFLKKHPEITALGIEDPKSDTYKRNRKDLLRATEEIISCILWIGKFYKATNRKKDEVSSYSLKHYVEKFYEYQKQKQYISNGSFIAAAGFLGINYQSMPDNQNVFIKMDGKILAQHHKLYK